MWVGPHEHIMNQAVDNGEAADCMPTSRSDSSFEVANGHFYAEPCRIYDSHSLVNYSKAARSYRFHSGHGQGYPGNHANGFVTYDTMDSSMDASNSLSLSSTDTKPDISQLSINTSPNSFANVMGMPSSSRYPAMSSHGYPTQSGSAQMQPFFDMGILGGMSPGGPPLQSPSLHSQSSMSPVHLHSPGGLTSPSGNFPTIQSPTSTMGPPYHPGQNVQAAMGAGPHFTSTKHICAICGDRASGKHYGVYSCEGCKGFFKRTVRKDLQYACRDEKNCLIDKRQRNRCQYCRYMKCLSTGMKREAVQEERQRAKERGEVEVESTTSANSEMPVEMILDAEMAVENQLDIYMDNPNDISGSLGMAAEKQMYSLVDWAKRIPHFTELSLEDQIILLKTGWNELLIAEFAHMSVGSLSMSPKDCIVLANGLSVYRANAQEAGLDIIFDRILTEIVSKMREMAMDKTELGCLRAIVLFNPDAKQLISVQAVESLREKVYATLEEFCKQQYPEEAGRFAKLLLRLPALRSIGLKCTELLFSNKLIGESIDSFLTDMLENPNPSN